MRATHEIPIIDSAHQALATTVIVNLGDTIKFNKNGVDKPTDRKSSKVVRMRKGPCGFWFK